MASNKRPGRDFSPRDAQEHKKLKQISGDNSSKQKSQPVRKSGSSTPDGASPLADGMRASLSNRTACNRSESRSSVSASNSRSGSPVRRRSSKNIDSPAESSGRPPLRISTPNQAAKGYSKVSAGPTSAKEASTSTNDLISRPTLKRANTASGAPSRKSSEDQSSVSLPPPRGPAPTAPMMGLSPAAIPTPATASSVITPLTAPEAATSTLTLATTGNVRSLTHVFSDIFKLDVQNTQTALRMERLKERLERLQKQASTEGSAGIEPQILALQRNLKNVETEGRDIEGQLLNHIGNLESTMEWAVNNYVSKGIGKVNDRVQALEERCQASEEKQGSRDSKLKAILSPLQVPESTNGVIFHDGLETMVQRIVKTELAAKFKGPLAPVASLPNGSTPKESPAPVKAPNGLSPNASAETQSEIDRVKKDLEVFKQQIYAKDKERDTKIEKLEQQNTLLKGQVTQLEGTKQKANNETSALSNSLTILEKGKADQNEVSALKDKVTIISGKLDNALSISNVVTRFQAEVKMIKDESKPIWDELNRIKKDMNTTTDPRRRIFQPPTTTTTTDVNPRFEAIQRSVDALTQRIDKLPAALEVSTLQKGAEKINEDIREIKEDHGKVLDRLDRHDERIDRHDERTERSERDLFSDNTRINEINQDLSNLGDEFANIERKVRHIDIDLGDLERVVEDRSHANANGFKKMEGEVKTRKVEITKIQEKMLHHEKEIKSLDSKIARMSEKSTPGNDETITARLGNLEAKQDSLQDSVSTTAQSVEALERSAIDAKTHKNAMDNIERKFERRHTALAKPFDEIQKRFDIIKQEHSSLLDKLDHIDAKLENADRERLPRDEIERRFDNVEKDQSSMHGTIANIDAKLDRADTEGQRRFDTIEKGQSSLQDKIDKIDVDLKTARERHESLLKSSDEHTKYISRLDRIMRGDEFTNLEMAFPRGAGLVQQLAELKSTVQAGRQLNRRQSTGNTAPAQHPDTVQQTSTSALGTLERRVTQIEREHASLKMATDGLRIDLDSFDESLAQQSELVEADVKQRVQDEVAKTLSSAHPPTQPTLTTEAVEDMIEGVARNIRNEMQDLHQEVTRRPISPTLKEIEEAAFERMERSTSRIVTEKLDGANSRLDTFHGRLRTVSDSVTRFDREFPANSGCAEAMADIVTFCRTYGKASDFLKATLEAIRNLQGRFDNMLTHQLANHISTLLLPHINHKLLGPIRDAVAPIVTNDLRQNHRQLSDKQQLLEMRFDELEQKVNATCDAALQDEMRKQSQEFLRSCANINERIDKDSRTTHEDFQKLWDFIEALKVDFGNDKSIIWENLREHRDNIERAQDDFGGVQACVVRIAKEVNKDLVPHDWLNLA